MEMDGCGDGPDINVHSFIIQNAFQIEIQT